MSTQLIWSVVADSSPAMCGSATLTIVVSSTWITVAAITASVTKTREPPPAATDCGRAEFIGSAL